MSQCPRCDMHPKICECPKPEAPTCECRYPNSCEICWGPTFRAPTDKDTGQGIVMQAITELVPPAKAQAPGAREWTLIVRGEPAHESTWHWEVLGAKATEYHDDTPVIEYAAYEALEREVKSKTEAANHYFKCAEDKHVELTQARAELAELRERLTDSEAQLRESALSGRNNIAFSELQKERDQARAELAEATAHRQVVLDDCTKLINEKNTERAKAEARLAESEEFLKSAVLALEKEYDKLSAAESRVKELEAKLLDCSKGYNILKGIVE